MKKKDIIGIIGLGYVGLPVFLSFSKKYKTIGYDIDKEKISNLKKKYNKKNNKKLLFVDDITLLEKCNIYIVIVPTPVDQYNIPDLSLLKSACSSLAKLISNFDTVIFESTVYPGATREICIPILENISGLKLNKEFGVGYSPERINPGDKNRSISDIVKITSGSNTQTSKSVDILYKKIITAGTHLAKSIEIAEAAKVIENTQRDINIALMNELSKIFHKLNISNLDVLKAANTKWNFLDFTPGLVGGHCIGVDPYYLTERALQTGYKPELILAGRKINDEMPKYVVDQFLKFSLKKRILKFSMRVLVMGITFKENCPDIRNSKSIEVIKILIEYGFDVDIYDPIANKDENLENLTNKVKFLKNNKYCGIIITVAHDVFKLIELEDLKKICINNGLIFDLKGIFPKDKTSWNL